MVEEQITPGLTLYPLSYTLGGALGVLPRSTAMSSRFATSSASESTSLRRCSMCVVSTSFTERVAPSVQDVSEITGASGLRGFGRLLNRNTLRGIEPIVLGWFSLSYVECCGVEKTRSISGPKTLTRIGLSVGIHPHTTATLTSAVDQLAIVTMSHDGFGE